MGDRKTPIRNSKKPKLIEGNLFIDDRGEVGFVNGFDMTPVKRFYTVTNHKSHFVRAWHAHRNEDKYVTVIDGAAIVAAVRIDNWNRPSKNLKIYKHVLSSKKPSVLFIPRGYANGFMTLKKDTKLSFFSTSTLKASAGDDVRYDAYYWNPWKVVEK